MHRESIIRDKKTKNQMLDDDDENPSLEKASKLLEAAQERYAPRNLPNPSNFPTMIREETNMEVQKGE